MVIVAESILVFQSLLSMWTILASGYEPRTFEYHDARRTLMPAAAEGDDTMYIDGRPLLIDVFITVYGEDIEVVRRTIRAAVALRGADRTWVLDDGRSDEVKEAAEQLGAWYVRRLSSNGAKAGRVPRRDGAVLRVLERRVRADAAGLRQPDDDHRPRCRLHADGVLPVRAARAEPVQRGLLRRHQRDLPTSASSTS
ncbi:hypothetical protein [Microbacterium lacticum]